VSRPTIKFEKYFNKEAVRKTPPRKINPLPLFPKNVRTGLTPSPPCPCGHTVNFQNPKFLQQKVQMSASKEPHLTNPLNADIFYDSP